VALNPVISGPTVCAVLSYTCTLPAIKGATSGTKAVEAPLSQVKVEKKDQKF